MVSLAVCCLFVELWDQWDIETFNLYKLQNYVWFIGDWILHMEGFTLHF